MKIQNIIQYIKYENLEYNIIYRCTLQDSYLLYRFLIGCTLERFQISQSVILEKSIYHFCILEKNKKSKSNTFNIKVKVNDFQIITNFSIVIFKTPFHVFFPTNHVDVSSIGDVFVPCGSQGKRCDHLYGSFWPEIQFILLKEFCGAGNL